MLTPSQLALLTADLAPLDTVEAGLAARAVAYVTASASDPATRKKLLADLERSAGAGRALQLSCNLGSLAAIVARRGRPAFFTALDDAAPDLLARLAEVYEAASRADERHLMYPQLPAWLEILLRESLAAGRAATLEAATLEKVLQHLAISPDTMARAALGCDARLAKLNVIGIPRLLVDAGPLALLSRLSGFDEYLVRHPQAITDALAQTTAATLVNVLSHLDRLSLALEPWRARIVALALGDQKSVREAAERLVLRDGEAARPLLLEASRSGGRTARAHAARLLPLLPGPAAEGRATEVDRLEIPPLDENIMRETPLADETRQALREMLDALHRSTSRLPRTPDDAMLDDLSKRLETPAARPLFNLRWLEPAALKTIERFLARAEVTLPQTVRLLLAFDLLLHPYPHRDLFDQLVDHYRRVHALHFGLREVEALAVACAAAPDIYLRRVLPRWENEVIWPYFMQRLDAFITRMGQKPGILERATTSPFEIIAKFPVPPPRLVPLLFDVALGTAKTDRPLAQAALETLPDLDERLLQRLASPRQEERANAAEWLGRRGVQAARPALTALLRKEKNETVRGSCMGALERLGAPLDEFIDVSRLTAEAKKGMARGMPAALSWLAPEKLPPLRWKGGEAVPAELSLWLIVQAWQQKSPEPGVLLRYCCEAFDENDRARLALHLLETWIAYDTIPAHDATEAAARAAKQATAMAQWAPQKTYEQHYKSALAFFTSECRGSATAEKGVLAVVGASGDARVVDVVDGYLARWYGYRAAQCRAMVAMLAWIDHPQAVHLLLRVADGFRTRSIQQEAAKAVEALAERKGWRVDELADRTVPRVGFDESGRLELDYGPRKFYAALTDDLDVRFENSAGNPLTTLPQPNEGDDADLAGAARKQGLALRKTLKTLLANQTARLLDAMCLQRGWRASDWRTFVLHHPIMGRLARGLVWTVAPSGADSVARAAASAVASVRPTAEGFVNARGDDVKVADDDIVRLAWVGALPVPERTAWRQHLVDYRLIPAFEQFGGEPYFLPEALRHATFIDEFEGSLIEAFKLRGRALKLGYERGNTEDGGRLYEYRQKFGVHEIRITFSGNQLPEENHVVALERLYFLRDDDGPLPLAEVPPVLLSTGWNHLQTLAAAGTGYAPDWATRVKV